MLKKIREILIYSLATVGAVSIVLDILWYTGIVELPDTQAYEDVQCEIYEEVYDADANN